MTSSPPAKRFNWENLRLRIVSGLVLAPMVFGVIWYGGPFFFVMVAVAGAFLAVEWGLMTAPPTPARTAFLVTAASLAPLFLGYMVSIRAGMILLPISAIVAALGARGLGWSRRSPDLAYGVLYIGFPMLVLQWLRGAEDGRGWTLLLFATTWSADICAYAAGNLLKGPKLWPRFSPNKTWSGFIFGLLGSVAAGAAVTLLWRREGAPGLALSPAVGLGAGLATMAGDLWESMLKRRFGVKDSGDLIPGHGGLLDRVDGLMFAVAAVAAARFAEGLVVHGKLSLSDFAHAVLG
jgi:phosphatidate cytidylyltransferase